MLQPERSFGSAHPAGVIGRDDRGVASGFALGFRAAARREPGPEPDVLEPP